VIAVFFVLMLTGIAQVFKRESFHQSKFHSYDCGLIIEMLFLRSCGRLFFIDENDGIIPFLSYQIHAINILTTFQ